MTSRRFTAIEALEVAARASPIASRNRRVVAVVGVGHMDGIEKRFPLCLFLYTLLTCKSASRWMDRFGEVSTIEIPDPE
jgi:hypothetical protein